MTINNHFARGVYEAPVCDVVMLNVAESVLQSSPLLLYGILGAAGAEQEFNLYDTDF